MKVLCVFGMRPEAIKMAPVVGELLKVAEQIETKIGVTTQHREMLDNPPSVTKWRIRQSIWRWKSGDANCRRAG